MATLQFKGKNIIWNHHMSVPYHTLDLDEKLSYKQDKADGNLIIEGDNLPALKSLLPQYTGKIDCIYIDPPYNTGEENWVYNDNVTNEMIKEWIGKVVNKEDLTRHDKWLCMMTPRLKLIRELLSQKGLLFISIDDVEVHNLRTLLDEIFTESNFIAQLPTITNLKGNQDEFGFAGTHEYILVYAYDKTKCAIKEFRDVGDEISDWEEDEFGYFKKGANLKATGQNAPREKRPNLFYPVFVDKNQNIYVTDDDKPKDKDDFVILPLTDGNEMSWRWEKAKISRESYNIILVGDESSYSLYKKQRPKLGDLPTKKPKTIFYKPGYSSGNGTREMKDFFGDKVFKNPKPSQLLFDILQISTDKHSIILDAFAGSGTTAQAVLELNEEDEGNRKFILIQMPENSEKEPKKNIARDITRERVVKVIEKKLENKDVGFEYRRVGQPIDAETILSGQLPTYKQLAKYVYYLATGQSPKDKDIDEKKYLAGKVDHTEVYLLYTPDMEELKKMAITFEWAKEISKGNDNKKIVYAPACFMDDEYLEQFNIKFVSIPYNLFEREK